MSVSSTVEIFVTTRFEGHHCWPDAPFAVAFLRDKHRHIFHVRADIPVAHNDRDIEFILLKRALDERIVEHWPRGLLGDLSCEAVAEELGTWLVASLGLPWAKVEVSEDGENGATVFVPVPV